jgi:hypothetical protein
MLLFSVIQESSFLFSSVGVSAGKRIPRDGGNTTPSRKLTHAGADFREDEEIVKKTVPEFSSGERLSF